MIRIKNKLGNTRIYSKKFKISKTYKEVFSTIKLPILKNKFNCGGLRLKNLFKNCIKNKPLISIIMPNFKCKDLKIAIESVLNQKYENLELIIIDGQSGPATLKILKFYEKDIDIWISEKDNGMWDAWNKGFKLANGNYVGIVDSSNILYKNSISILLKYISKQKYDFICGAVKKDNKVYAGFRPHDIKKQFNIIPSSVVGFFIKLNSLKKVGLVNTRYKIQADYDLLYRIIVTNKMIGRSTKGHEIFGDLGNSGFSSRHSFFYKLINEILIRYRNRQNPICLFYILFGRVIVKLLKTIPKIKFL